MSGFKPFPWPFFRESQVLEVPYIELYSLLVSDDTYRTDLAKNDGAHPTSTGYSRIASLVCSSFALVVQCTATNAIVVTCHE